MLRSVSHHLVIRTKSDSNRCVPVDKGDGGVCRHHRQCGDTHQHVAEDLCWGIEACELEARTRRPAGFEQRGGRSAMRYCI